MAADMQHTVGKPNTDEEGDNRGKSCDLERDEQRGKCLIGHYFTVNPYFSKTLAALSVWRKARNSFRRQLILGVLQHGGGVDDGLMCVGRATAATFTLSEMAASVA